MKVQAALPLRVQAGPSARRPTRRALARWAATCSAVSADRFGRVKGVGRRKAARRTDSRLKIGLLRGEGLGDWPWFAGGLALEQVADTSDADRGGILLLAETGRVALAVVKDLGDELVLLADPGADGREGLSLAGQAGQRLVAAAIDRGGDIAVGQPDSRLRGVEPLTLGLLGGTLELAALLLELGDRLLDELLAPAVVSFPNLCPRGSAELGPVGEPKHSE